MTDFQTFPPAPVVVQLSCGALELTPVRLGELPRLLTVVRPFADAISAEPDWLALLAAHGNGVLELLALTTRRERAWIDDLSLDDAVQLAAAVFEVNADFFVHRVVPGIARSADQLAPLIRTLGTAPSPA
ncbi:MAG: hypothetical protein KJ049_01895 [Gammaproteobacteria bacterium]|nr:hypothetical protein [Gammaproteobacteria bacterium]